MKYPSDKKRKEGTNDMPYKIPDYFVTTGLGSSLTDREIIK